MMNLKMLGAPLFLGPCVWVAVALAGEADGVAVKATS